MTITAVVHCEKKTYFRISSWGKLFYIDADEYADYMKKKSTPLFTNIMYVKKY